MTPRFSSWSDAPGDGEGIVPGLTNPTTSTAASPVTTTGGRLHGSLPVEQWEATGFPGRRVGGTTMVLGPFLMLTGARNAGRGLRGPWRRPDCSPGPSTRGWTISPSNWCVPRRQAPHRSGLRRIRQALRTAAACVVHFEVYTVDGMTE